MISIAQKSGGAATAAKRTRFAIAGAGAGAAVSNGVRGGNFRFWRSLQFEAKNKQRGAGRREILNLTIEAGFGRFSTGFHFGDSQCGGELFDQCRIDELCVRDDGTDQNGNSGMDDNAESELRFEN